MSVTDLGKGDLVRALIDVAPFYPGRVLTVSVVGELDSNVPQFRCKLCGPESLTLWVDFEEEPVARHALPHTVPGRGGWRIAHFAKLSGPPNEELIREAERDNLVPNPRIRA